MNSFIKTMAPGWFASVMGTAVSSLALTLLAQRFPTSPLAMFGADFFHWSAICLMVCLTVPAILRILFYPKAVLQTLRHPVEGSFYATFPIALLVMAGQWTVRGMPVEAIATLWWTGTICTFLISYIVLFNLFSGEALKPGMVTPAHFIPAVGLVVIPVAGASLAGAASGLMREVYFGINMLGFGAGSFMYLGLVALTMQRHFLGTPIEGKMTPTLLVHLAPLGVIPLSLLSLLHAAGDASAMHYGTLVASGFLGAGLWWFVLAFALTIRNASTGRLPFALSWWAFVFPIGAITVLSLRLSTLMNLSLLPYVASVLAAILSAIWLAAAIGTVRGLVSGSIFVPHEPSHKPV